jgi:hypothetical protein
MFVQVTTKPVADLEVFMGNRWANMGSFMGSKVARKLIRRLLIVEFLYVSRCKEN